MAAQQVHLVVELTLHEGQQDAFNRLAQQMTAGTQTEAGALTYDWYMSSDGQHCRLLETYADANALLAHFTGPVVQQLVPQLAQIVTIDTFEVYGDPGPQVAAMLAGFGAVIFQRRYGLDGGRTWL